MNESFFGAVEAVVAFLTPIACREHVLGDLRERNETLRSYVLDAARVIPCIIWSRVLRTTPPRLLLLQGAAIAACFVASTIAYPEYFQGPVPLVGIALPVVAGLLGLVIADAYRDDPGPGDAQRQAIRRTRPIQWAFVAGGLTQFVLFFLRPDWFLPPKLTLLASALIWLLLMAVRASVMSGPVSSARADPPREARRKLRRMLLFYGIFGAGVVYFLSGVERLPWLAMSLVSFYSAFRVYRLPESSAVSDAERLAMASRLFLRWASAPIVWALTGAVLLNPLRHPEQPELLLRTVPVLALSLVWYWSAWKRSRGLA